MKSIYFFRKALYWFKISYVYIIIALIYIPLFIVVAISFNHESSKGNITFDYSNPTIDNYINMFKSIEFANSLSNTIVIGIIITPISTIIATITAFAIRKSRAIYRETTLFVSNVSIINPDVITAVALAVLIASTWIPLGMPKGFATIILSHISFTVPYAIISIYPRVTKLDESLILASKDLGYSGFKTFWKIVFPYMLPSILIGASLVFAMSFDDFIITRLVGGRVSTIATEMYTMSKGIKTWVTSFGSIILLLTFAILGTTLIYKKTSMSKKVKVKKYE